MALAKDSSFIRRERNREKFLKLTKKTFSIKLSKFLKDFLKFS